jgi:hypothetical protein
MIIVTITTKNNDRRTSKFKLSRVQDLYIQMISRIFQLGIEKITSTVMFTETQIIHYAHILNILIFVVQHCFSLAP